jgi:hypothetical protein
LVVKGVSECGKSRENKVETANKRYYINVLYASNM